MRGALLRVETNSDAFPDEPNAPENAIISDQRLGGAITPSAEVNLVEEQTIVDEAVIF
jgi:hypothetical protein